MYPAPVDRGGLTVRQSLKSINPTASCDMGASSNAVQCWLGGNWLPTTNSARAAGDDANAAAAAAYNTDIPPAARAPDLDGLLECNDPHCIVIAAGDEAIRDLES